MTKKLALGALVALLVVSAGVLTAANRDLAEDAARTARAWAAGNGDGDDVRAFSDFDLIRILNSTRAQVVQMNPDEVGDGLIAFGDRFGNFRGALLVGADGAGRLALTNSGGEVTFILDGHSGLFSVTGDLAEAFPAAPGIPLGSVVAIDPERPGRLQVASTPYDRRVAGVVSGANDYNPAITLKAIGTDARHANVTLSGTVYCRVTRANGAIRAGDLLTSSAVSGHAMRVTDHGAAHGAVIGKAMEDFDGESGLIMVLANLQ